MRKQYIKTGLLYYIRRDVPVYGVGVGNIETTVTDSGGKIVDRTKDELLTVTPKRISFWQEGLEVAYLSGKKLHFPVRNAGGLQREADRDDHGGLRLGLWAVDDCGTGASTAWKTRSAAARVCISGRAASPYQTGFRWTRTDI